MAEKKSKSGKQAILFGVTKGTLVVGDASTPLSDNTWYMINSYAAATALPFEDDFSTPGRVFKTPDSGNAITPAVGDDVYPLTFEKLCKVDASISTEKGTIDVTDDCEAGYNAYIVDGFTDISGSISGYMKYNVPGGGVANGQKDLLTRFFDIQEDDGAGTYALTQKNDDDIYLAILGNSDQVDEGDIQVWNMIPAILSGITMDKPLKGVQNFDSNWSKAQGPACIYERTTNSSETVF